MTRGGSITRSNGSNKACVHSSCGHFLARLSGFGRCYILDRVTSTNDFARGLVTYQEPAIVMSHWQTRGRGRHGRKWFSAPGGLYFSYLLFPGHETDLQCNLLTLRVGLACAAAIYDLSGIATEIFWPNDLLVHGRKLAGVLCETKRNAVIIGCGVNVNQASFPLELTEAVSLRMLTGREYGLLELLWAIVMQFRTFAARLPAVELIDQVKARMPMLGRKVRVHLGVGLRGMTGERCLTGTALDVDPSGQLVFRTTDDRLVLLHEGIVRLER